MNPSKRIDRKLFLTFTLTSTAALALGCSSDQGSGPVAAGGSSGAGGGAGGSTAGAAGSGGSSSGAGGTAGSAGASGGAPITPNCNTQLKTMITANHGHVLAVSAADVMAGVTKVYDTKGTSTHSHWIQLTAADLAKLQAGGTVRKASCNDGHEHEFIVNCVGVAEPMTTSGISQYCDGGHQCAGSDTNFCPAVPDV